MVWPTRLPMFRRMSRHGPPRRDLMDKCTHSRQWFRAEHRGKARSSGILPPSPQSRRGCRSLQLLFPHYAILRDQLRKLFLDQSHLLDSHRLARRRSQRLRRLSSPVVKTHSSNVASAPSNVRSRLKLTLPAAVSVSANDPLRTCHH